MPFREVGSQRYFSFQSLDKYDIPHGIFTRRGGNSPSPWNSLNVGGTVGDDPERVENNRHRIFNALNRPLNSVNDVWQVHGKEVICVDSPRNLDEAHLKADGILTNQKDITLFMRFADCVPIVLFDPVHQVIGLVHAGWVGTVLRIAANAVQSMRTCYNSLPQDLVIGIGPSIGPDHYEVGQEVIDRVEKSFGKLTDQVLLPTFNYESGRQARFDLWTANKIILEQAGVKKIEVSNICTACHTDDWYSHRMEMGRTGRFGALIAL